jgi:hypothetical protein
MCDVGVFRLKFYLVSQLSQALKSVSEKDRIAVHNSYISHVTQYFGVTHATH